MSEDSKIRSFGEVRDEYRKAVAATSEFRKRAFELNLAVSEAADKYKKLQKEISALDAEGGIARYELEERNLLGEIGQVILAADPEAADPEQIRKRGKKE